MKKLLFALITPLLLLAAPAPVSATSLPAPLTTFASACDAPFLTFRPWYHGLTAADCELIRPGVEGSGDMELPVFIWRIILNVLFNLFSLGGYLAVGFIIYGGIIFMLARGMPDKIAKGKSTITNAIIGLIISLLAVTIVAVITSILL